MIARLLLLADTHLGFDLPFRPRIERRRRGHDFFANLDRALAPALAGEADLVVHGGDLFFRSKVPAALIEMALAPFLQVARAGVPVIIVPGNHERSRIPRHLWGTHPDLHIFDRPSTLTLPVDGGIVALAGFPFERRIRDRFGELVEATGWREGQADMRFLCLHQTVEGAQVGPSDYTFRRGPDIIDGHQIPTTFCAVLAGHIHRAQTLGRDLSGRPLGAPVIYPGSIERTSFAERDEPKGYVLLRAAGTPDGRGELLENRFVPLPARPMVDVELFPEQVPRGDLQRVLRERLGALDPESIVRLRVHGPPEWIAEEGLTAAVLRSLGPPTMNIDLALPRPQGRKRDGREGDPSRT